MPTPCPSWCRDDHAAPVDFHETPPEMFYVTHGETRVPEECAVSLKAWNDVRADDDEPAAVVLAVETDFMGEAWLTVEQARLLAEHLLVFARQLERAAR